MIFNNGDDKAWDEDEIIQQRWAIRTQGVWSKLRYSGFIFHITHFFKIS